MKLNVTGSEKKPGRSVIRIGVSACLAGASVRFDGGHEKSSFVTESLGKHAVLVPVCPEVELGLGTPREALRLVRTSDDSIRLVGSRSGVDRTEEMKALAARRADELARARLSGFILKRASPSCGLQGVRVYDQNDAPARDGTGLFAQALKARLPLLPIEEEGCLADPRLRESFCERVFAWSRLERFFSQAGWTIRGLVGLHSSEKMLLMSHSPEHARWLGRLVATARSRSLEQTQSIYSAGFMEALQQPVTRSRHVDALQHIAGYFKRSLPGAERQSVAQTIADYRSGFVPLSVPVSLLRHLSRGNGVSWLSRQTYLDPAPRELATRSWT